MNSNTTFKVCTPAFPSLAGKCPYHYNKPHLLLTLLNGLGRLNYCQSPDACDCGGLEEVTVTGIHAELDELHESDRYHYNMEWEINVNTLVTVITVHDAVLYLPL